ncbi:MAG: Crp/Fnr family transcriptional regulator [Bacteroidales bacterium]|nr:Crp/Fnr family transcriptional regulator [Bacteroidales bacterium]
MGNLWFFDNVKLFSIFCPHKFAEFRESHQFRNYKKGEFIYFSDDPSSTIYLLAKGKVKILYYTEEGDEVVKSVLSTGDIFGELSLLGEDKRKDFAQVVQEGTSVCHLTLEQMDELMKKDRNLVFKINKLIGLRIQKLERRLESLVFKDVRTRMVEFLRDIALEKGEGGGPEYRIDHFLTHKDMADLIGTTRQTVTTLLNELRNEGRIDFTRRNIYIPDINALSSG